METQVLVNQPLFNPYSDNCLESRISKEWVDDVL